MLTFSGFRIMQAAKAKLVIFMHLSETTAMTCDDVQYS